MLSVPSVVSVGIVYVSETVAVAAGRVNDPSLVAVASIGRVNEAESVSVPLGTE